MLNLPQKFKTTRYRNLIVEIIKRQPKLLVEIGVWSGDTGLLMLDTALQYNSQAFYFGIDLWELLTPNMATYEHHTKRSITYESVREKFSAKFPKILEYPHPYTESRTAKRHTTHHKHWAIAQGISHVELERFRTTEIERTFRTKYVDFVFIDGGHSNSTILNDWLVVQSLMDDKTVVLFDDYYENTNSIGARNTVEFIVKSGDFNIEYLLPVDEFKFPDGSPQPTQMVKVTRKAGLR